MHLISTLRWAQNRNRLALVAAVDPKVGPIDRNHGMFREEFAHPDKAQIREVGLPIGITVCEPGELDEVIAAVECQADEPLIHHGEDNGRALEVKGRFGENGFARQERFGYAGRELHRPGVVLVVGIGKRDQESRVGNSLHERVKPLRVDRSRAPRTVPASRMKDCSPPLSRAFSSCSRMIRPRGTPERLETCSSQVASSFVRRIVTV